MRSQLTVKSVTLRVSICIFITGFIVCLSQACGKFNAANGVVVEQSVGPDLSIVPESSSAAVEQSLVFDAAGVSLSTKAIYSWTHTLSEDGGGTLSPCTEVLGNAGPRYQLLCVQGGNLNIQLLVTDGVHTYGPVQIAETVSSVAPTPTPTPSLLPTPNPAGVALFAQACASCHGELAANNINQKTYNDITSAIQTVSSMSSISLTTAQITAIVNALNGN